MATRKGLGKGKGKGYKNLQGKDPRVHSDSARGRKQPQKLSPRVEAMLKKDPKLKGKTFKQLQKEGVFLRYQSDSDGDGVVNVHDCRPLNPKMHKDEAVTEIEFDPTVEEEKTKFQRFKSKAGAFIKKEAKLGYEVGKKTVKSQLQKRKEAKEKEKIEELESVHHPLAKSLTKQKERVETLKTQIAETEDEEREEKLFDELEKEQNQLREAQEKITELKVVDMSDRELKTLAIRWQPSESFFADMFGSGDNPYSKELKRRIVSEKTIEKELAEARKEKPEEEGLF